MVSTYWVFLRGLVREIAHWDDFPLRFEAGIPNAQVHLFDLPGNGRHWRQPSPLSLRESMEAVRGEALQLMGSQKPASQPFYLFSISLGGMIAVEWAHRHPQELAGAVLTNTSLRDLSPLNQRLSRRIWPLLARIVTERDVGRRESLILEMTSAVKEPRPGLIESRIAIHNRHPVQVKNVFRQLWAAARYRPPIGKPSIPILLLDSLGDRMVDPRCTEAIARRWSLEPRTHPWAGHDLPLDDPGWVIAEVGNWLKSLTPIILRDQARCLDRITACARLRFSGNGDGK